MSRHGLVAILAQSNRGRERGGFDFRRTEAGSTIATIYFFIILESERVRMRRITQALLSAVRTFYTLEFLHRPTSFPLSRYNVTGATRNSLLRRSISAPPLLLVSVVDSSEKKEAGVLV
jgi:hypothetical protein